MTLKDKVKIADALGRIVRADQSVAKLAETKKPGVAAASWGYGYHSSSGGRDVAR